MNQKAERWEHAGTDAQSLPPGPDKLRAVIKELDVEHNERYKADAKRTWCNIFVTDVCDAMKVAPSHWVTSNGEPAKPAPENRELNANGIVEWLRVYGGEHGWFEMDRLPAFDAASRGHLVLVVWHSGSKAPGHVAVLLPEGTIAQAGRRNFVGETIPQGFGTKPVTFWVQIFTGTHKSTESSE